MNAVTVSREEMLGRLPPVSSFDPVPEIQSLLKEIDRKVVVLDDDPTGTQTVHDVPIITVWDVGTLEDELRDPARVVYILTNSRSLPEAAAVELNCQIIRNLRTAAASTGRQYTVISRSDSTLRGHFPAELHAVEIAEGTSFDGWILCPFFQEGGRLTINNVLYVAEGDRLIPAAETAFARDAAFGYTCSDLRDWIVEKSGGRIPIGQISSLSLEDLRCGDLTRCVAKTTSLENGQVCIINAVERRDMEMAVAALMRAEAAGKRFLYRTAASFVAVRSGVPPRPLLTAYDLRRSRGTGVLVVVGSYVPKSTEQLDRLLASTDATAIELGVESLLDDSTRETLLGRAAADADRSLADNRTVVLYTSRRIVHKAGEGSLAIGRSISQALMDLLERIETEPRVLIAKGGITSSDVATKACRIRRANVMGQILPGVPVWECGPESRYPGMPLVVFPGNVGDADALRAAVAKAGG